MKKKYKVLRNVLKPEVCNFLKNYFLEKEKIAKLYFAAEFISQFNKEYGVFNDPQVPGSYAIYGPKAGDINLEQLKPLIEKTMRKKLYETYSYVRVYNKGNELKRHKDRSNCKISATVNLGGEEWPIYIENNPNKGTAMNEKDSTSDYVPGNTKGEAVILKPGDLLLYPGFHLEHWRKPLPQGKCVQLFLHYVDSKQSDAEQRKYDGRPRLGVDQLLRKKQKG